RSRGAGRPRVVVRPRRHEHPDAPGRLSRRGHLRPPASGSGGPGRPRAHRPRSSEREVSGCRTAGVSVSASTLVVDSLDFDLPPALEATEPAEVHGRGRDDVRLLVARRHDLQLAHARFWQLPDFLEPGDLVVINTSATLPAAVSTQNGLELHFSTSLPGG